ncbi:hypothetical protein [Pyrodictium abyssi]|uniref:GerMN domain-containing protein n=1 Tax=Pyrodictium abyssi TaxID=54256 RepID=A0ABM8IVR1_9CREN|nr:hypothetical protein PABY_04730 [Pyrodictium abyssi]
MGNSVVVAGLAAVVFSLAAIVLLGAFATETGGQQPGPASVPYTPAPSGVQGSSVASPGYGAGGSGAAGGGWAVGEASAAAEPVTVSTAGVLSVSSSSGAVGELVYPGWLVVSPGPDVDVAKLVVNITNADVLRRYFSRLDVVLAKAGTGGREVKAVVGLDAPTAVMVLDSGDLSSGPVVFDAIVYYQVREGAMFDTIPVYVEVTPVSVS